VRGGPWGGVDPMGLAGDAGPLAQTMMDKYRIDPAAEIEAREIKSVGAWNALYDYTRITDSPVQVRTPDGRLIQYSYDAASRGFATRVVEAGAEGSTYVRGLNDNMAAAARQAGRVLETAGTAAASVNPITAAAMFSSDIAERKLTPTEIALGAGATVLGLRALHAMMSGVDDIGRIVAEGDELVRAAAARSLDDLFPKGSIGAYNDVRGHHIFAGKAFEGVPRYDYDSALALGKDCMAARGWNHRAMTAKQQELFAELSRSGRQNTFSEHARIANAALFAGGVPTDIARALVDRAAIDMVRSGVTAPARIPWHP